MRRQAAEAALAAADADATPSDPASSDAPRPEEAAAEALKAAVADAIKAKVISS